MTTSPNRRGLTSGSFAAILGIVAVAGVVVALSLDAGKTTTVASADNQPSAESATAATPPVSSVPPQAPSVPTPPPASDIPDEQKPEAQVRVKPATLQFGYVEPGESKSMTFELINQSDQPLNLTAAKKGCSCTEVELTPGIISPGDSTEITAIFTAGLTPTKKNNKVGVLFEKHRSVTVPMQAIVSRKVQVSPQDFRMHRDSSYEGPVVRTKGRIQVSSIDGRPIRILSAGGQPPIAWPSSGGDPMIPSISHEMVIDIGEHDQETLLDPDGNLLPAFWVYETDHPEAPVVEVRIVHQAHRPHRREKEREWVFVENRVVVDAVPPGGSATFELPIIWNSRDQRTQQIHEVVSNSPDFRADLIGMRADGTKTKAIVRITPSEGVQGPYQGKIEFVSREHRAPLSVIGYVNTPTTGEGEGT